MPIEGEADLVEARRAGRELAEAAGITGAGVALVATAITEVATNILRYAERGALELRVVHREGRCGLEVTARDQGPGIDDLERALEDGFSTGQGLGLGLPGARRLMDEFDIQSGPLGTVVTMTKWARGA